MPEEQGRIIVERPSGRLQDRFRTYSVLIDHVESAKLASGESTVIAVTPGPHVLEAQIDGIKSRKEQLEISSGETKSYLVKPARKGGALRALFSPSGEWVTIEPKDDH